jgi:hypothetical protein
VQVEHEVPQRRPLEGHPLGRPPRGEGEHAERVGRRRDHGGAFHVAKERRRDPVRPLRFQDFLAVGREVAAGEVANRAAAREGELLGLLVARFVRQRAPQNGHLHSAPHPPPPKEDDEDRKHAQESNGQKAVAKK